MYIGYGPDERGLQLVALDAMLRGYANAVDLHNIDDPGGPLPGDLAEFLFQQRGWSKALGPIEETRRRASSDEDAWKMFWDLVDEFEAARSASSSVSDT